jgi:hypothetical protein
MRAARSRNIGTGGSQKGQSRASPHLEGGESAGPRAPGPAARGIWAVPAYAAPARAGSAGAVLHGRCDADRAPPAVPAAAVPGFSATAAPSGLTLKSRDRRMPVPVGTCLKLQPHARNQAALGLMFGLFAEPAPLMPETGRESSPPGVTVRSESDYGRSVLRWTWGRTKAAVGPSDLTAGRWRH